VGNQAGPGTQVTVLHAAVARGFVGNVESSPRGVKRDDYRTPASGNAVFSVARRAAGGR